MKKRGFNHLLFESKPTICKRCGSKDVAWTQNKAGKWYLVEGGYCHPDFTRETGIFVWNKIKYHKCIKKDSWGKGAK